jgi:hypothetical protein
VEDVTSFAEACLLSLLTALPFVVFAFQGAAALAYLPVVVVSAMSIMVVSLITALSDRYRWRLLVYCVVLALIGYVAADETFAPLPIYSGSRLISLMIVQVVFGMGVFYYVLHRRQIAERAVVQRQAAQQRDAAR